MPQQATYRNMDRMLTKGIALISEYATMIDLKNHFIKTERQKIDFDYIVIATGASYNYDAVPGLESGTYNFYNHLEWLLNSVLLKYTPLVHTAIKKQKASIS